MIVFPMAGLSRRFTEAGYTIPKYMLKAGGQTIFNHVLAGFESCFADFPFLFIYRDVFGTGDFLRAECAALGIMKYHLIELRETTRGQAETVALGLKSAMTTPETPLTIFNIDTIRPHFRYPSAEQLVGYDGYMEVFRGVGDGWSFARTASETDPCILETAEKRRISDLCSNGLYHFSHYGDFMDAFSMESARPSDVWDAKELYIAPLYNHMIRRGQKILAVEVPSSSMIPCGIPSEYESFRQFCAEN
jgi:hypothetical protein